MSDDDVNLFDNVLGDLWGGTTDLLQEQVDLLTSTYEAPVSAASEWLSDQAVDLLENSPQPSSLWKDIPEDTLRAEALGSRTECMSIQIPGIQGAEYLASAADWWASQAYGFLGGPVRVVGQVNESINQDIKAMLGLQTQSVDLRADKPFAQAQLWGEDPGYLVQVPGWQDIIQVNSQKILKGEQGKLSRFDRAELLRRSPVPLGVREIGELLTALDNVQDALATLSVVMMIAEKLAGRAIPGIGWVATATDALNLIYAVASLGTGSTMPGRAAKRRAIEKAKGSHDGMAGRLEDLRRSGALKVGIGDLLQGLQATSSWFGTGIQLGGIMGLMQDSFWGVVRGAEFRAPGPWWDPIGLHTGGPAGCFRSPSLAEVHPKAYYAVANTALSCWSSAARIMPYMDLLDEAALASTLMSMRMSEQALGPWLRSGVWIDPLSKHINSAEYIGGGVEAHETRHVRPDEWLKRTVPAATVALTRSIAAVRHPERQSFYSSLASTIGKGLLAGIEPTARLVGYQPRGHLADAFTLLDSNKIPRFDLDD